jgi:hypothetical protein
MALTEIACKPGKEAVNIVASGMKRSSTTRTNTPKVTEQRSEKSSQSRKVDRKHERRIAHRYVERRRRSKMNDEFTTLRDMIPSCEGQDMQKLAILQARAISVWLNNESN